MSKKTKRQRQVIRTDGYQDAFIDRNSNFNSDGYTSITNLDDNQLTLLYHNPIARIIAHMNFL